MFVLPWIVFICCSYISPVIFQTMSNIGDCRQPNSSSIKCCINFFLSGTKCKECDPGFIGENCSVTCPPGYYGPQCLEQCDCPQDMYCEPTRGCLCNTTSVNCTDRGHEHTQEMTTILTTKQSVEPAGDSTGTFQVVPLLIPATACLVLGTVCIRIRFSQMKKKKRKDLFSMQNATVSTARTQRSETEEDNPNEEIYDHLNLRIQHSNHSLYDTGRKPVARESSSVSGYTTEVPIRHSESEKKIQNKWSIGDKEFRERNADEAHGRTVDNMTTNRQEDIYATPCKSITKKHMYGYSKQRQRKDDTKTLKFERPNSSYDTGVHEPKSWTKGTPPPKSTQGEDEEIYANGDSMI